MSGTQGSNILDKNVRMKSIIYRNMTLKKNKYVKITTGEADPRNTCYSCVRVSFLVLVRQSQLNTRYNFSHLHNCPSTSLYIIALSFSMWVFLHRVSSCYVHQHIEKFQFSEVIFLWLITFIPPKRSLILSSCLYSLFPASTVLWLSYVLHFQCPASVPFVFLRVDITCKCLLSTVHDLWTVRKWQQHSN